MRRSVVVLVVAALAATSTAASAARKPALAKCATFTDIKGDSALLGQTALGEQSLDITSVRVAVVGDALVARITLDKLSPTGPTKSWGDRFQFGFSTGTDKIDFYYKQGPTREVESQAFYQQGLRVNSSFRTDAGISATRDVATNTVTLSAKLSTIKAHLGRAIQGATITAMWSDALGSYVAANQTYDSAVAPEKQGFKVAACA